MFELFRCNLFKIYVYDFFGEQLWWKSTHSVWSQRCDTHRMRATFKSIRKRKIQCNLVWTSDSTKLNMTNKTAAQSHKMCQLISRWIAVHFNCIFHFISYFNLKKNVFFSIAVFRINSLQLIKFTLFDWQKEMGN